MAEKLLRTVTSDQERPEKKQKADRGGQLETTNASKFSISCAPNTLRDSQYQTMARSEHTEKQADSFRKSIEIANEYLQEENTVKYNDGFPGPPAKHPTSDL